MVLIHLAKMDLLRKSCDYFTRVCIPEEVKDEVIKGGYAGAQNIKELIEEGKIDVKEVNNNLIKKANQFNIQRGEAAAVALYWELKAGLLATDDDNVRKKRDMLKINIIGTPAIILQLYKEKKIKKNDVMEAVKKLKEIGWFANTIWDKIQLEVEKNE